MASLDFEQERASFRTYYNEKLGTLKPVEAQLRTLINSLLSQSPDLQIDSVTSRVKDREECIRKFSRKYQIDLETAQQSYEIKDHITDLIGLRVVCLYEDQISVISEILSKQFEVIEISDKAAAVESSDDLFGYKGLHLDLKIIAPRADLPEYRLCRGLRFEVQIRTICQDAWSILDHKIKYKKIIPVPLRRRINSLAALFELADHEFLRVRDETQKLEKAKLANVESSLKQSRQTPVDTFTFVSIVQDKFPSYTFLGLFVDGFVEEVLKHDPEITSSRLKQIVVDTAELVNEYATYQNQVHLHNLNPYTQLRHMLYLSDKVRYRVILYDRQRTNFDRWLSESDRDQQRLASS